MEGWRGVRGVGGVLLPERWAQQRQTGGQREKNKGRGHTTLGEEGSSCGLVEPPVLRMSVVHLDLAGSPSQGESWVGLRKTAGLVSLHTQGPSQGSLLSFMSGPC